MTIKNSLGCRGNNNYEIIVGIPTYNEADSIKNTLMKVDRGIAKHYPGYRSLIINIDSDSNDETKSVFLSTKTETPKIAISGGHNPRGKGANITSLFRLSKKFHAKYIATIDADVVTITEEWPKLLLGPVINKTADFVAPLYTRNRYEGNTTNHFCFPIMYAWFGRALSQPIGGDFGMSKCFVDYIIQQPKPPDAYLYGIDIFLSSHAIGGNFKTTEVHLGRKIHKPSFDKIIPMFHQVASTMIYILARCNNKHQGSFYQKTDRRRRIRTDEFIRKPNRSKIAFLKSHALYNLKQLSPSDIHKYFGVSPEKARLISRNQTLVQENQWIEILSGLLDYISKYNVGYVTASKIAALTSPFFFLRVLSYFREFGRDSERRNVDKIILRQAQRLRNIFHRDSQFLR